MQLVIGGAFSGKRKVVKETNGACSWVSAYQGDRIEDWESHWLHGTTLVIEGLGKMDYSWSFPRVKTMTIFEAYIKLFFKH